jgi:hypothetical protein
LRNPLHVGRTAIVFSSMSLSDSRDRNLTAEMR